MVVTINDVDKIYKDISPLCFGRRLMFKKYCENLVKNGEIRQRDVDKYTSEHININYYKNSNELNEMMNNYFKDNEGIIFCKGRDLIDVIIDLQKSMEKREVKKLKIKGFLFNIGVSTLAAFYTLKLVEQML